MKNKIKFKNYLFSTLIILLFMIIMFLIIGKYEYNAYTKNYNNKLNMIVGTIKSKYPNIDDEDIIDIFNNKDINEEYFKQYGIDIEKESVIIENNQLHNKFIIINISFIVILIFILLLVFIRYDFNKDKDIKEITKYIKEINKNNYNIDIDKLSEDELSILKEELYKITVMLKMSSINSLNDKLEVKKSIEDISHQLKTPLTSILIMLNNILDDEDMDENVKKDFLRDIKKEVMKINSLIQILLKLSKFDSNSIEFIKKNNSIKKIILESIKNVSSLSDLKNITINFNIKEDIKINCDYMWEVEAISNIIKNSIEHSYENNKIDILVEKKNTYTTVIIKDYGSGISKSDLPHIFERFYQSKNSNTNNFGIGLCLSKSIIEKDNGKIYVKSNNNGCEFIIKYFNV